MAEASDKKIILEDGQEFYGHSFGASEEKILEIVFNTSMVGYQEILSDPSYMDQAVVMTYPLIGNYGMAADDYETETPSIGAMIVREYNDEPSNFRADATLSSVMRQYGIAGISGVDTRKLNRSIRDFGSRRALLTDASAPLEEGIVKLSAWTPPRDAVARVSCTRPRTVGPEQARAHVVAIDCGMKRNIARSLTARGCRVTVVPWDSSAEFIRFLRPDGIFLSNGPGDPTDVPQTIETIRGLIGEYEAIIINNNPETVSTDYTCADKLYFEPLTPEDVMNVIALERAVGVIATLGGQTAINLAEPLSRRGAVMIGTDYKAIDRAENRDSFEKLLLSLGIPQPEGRAVTSLEEGIRAAREIGYPVLVRPSFVLGGRAMQIVAKEESMWDYLRTAVQVDADRPVLVDRYIRGKEVEVDAVCDGRNVFVPGIMELVERTGVHSGDSVRTVPFLSKATGFDIAEIGTLAMLGLSLREQGLFHRYPPEKKRYYVKVPAFSFAKLRGMDAYLSPEMKSTGEAIGYDDKLHRAAYKAMLAAGLTLRSYGTVLVSVADEDKEETVPLIRRFYQIGFSIEATTLTGEVLKAHGIRARIRRKPSEGSEEVLDSIRAGYVSYVINTRAVLSGVHYGDGVAIRRCAAQNGVTMLTSLDTVRLLLDVLEETTIGISTIDAE